MSYDLLTPLRSDMLRMQPYKGPFSFVTSELHSDVKTVLPNYDKHDPKTWPYVTMAVVEQYGSYRGYPDLPAGIAYERSIMKRYESMYSAADRKHIASVNGSFHKRYPCNYDQHDKPKTQVGMSDAEYQNYMAPAATDTLADTPTSQLRRPQRKRKSDTKRNKSHDDRRCAKRRTQRLGARPPDCEASSLTEKASYLARSGASGNLRRMEDVEGVQQVRWSLS